MAKAYYSTVFAQSADDIWNAIRDFNNYPIWVDGAGDSKIEDGKSGDAVGAVRDVLYRGQRIRQRLVALSDAERSQVYEFCGAAPMPVQHYRATLKITPIVDGGRGFVEWWATFDCAPERLDEWAAFFRDAFAGWLGSLRRYLDGRNSSFDRPAAK
jgi:Polyketide cyclase / dehydrase and lipid transport